METDLYTTAELEGTLNHMDATATAPAKPRKKVSKHSEAAAYAQREVLKHVHADNLPADLEGLREVFAQIRNACPTGKADFNAQVKLWMANAADQSPRAWVLAGLKVYTRCEKCRGSGTYEWGPCVNGKMTYSGPCFACNANGTQDHADWIRNHYYWAYFARLNA